MLILQEVIGLIHASLKVFSFFYKFFPSFPFSIYLPILFKTTSFWCLCPSLSFSLLIHPPNTQSTQIQSHNTQKSNLEKAKEGTNLASTEKMTKSCWQGERKKAILGGVQAGRGQQQWLILAKVDGAEKRHSMVGTGLRSGSLWLERAPMVNGGSADHSLFFSFWKVFFITLCYSLFFFFSLVPDFLSSLFG